MGAIRVVAEEGRRFADRAEAGEFLARELSRHAGRETVALGIPRGGMVVAAEVARKLEANLDIVLSRKLRAPNNPELAIGAVGEDSRAFLHGSTLAWVRADAKYIEDEKNRQLREIALRSEKYRAVWPRVPLRDKTVILVDDGIATGATMLAAVWSTRRDAPRRIIVAAPVAPRDALERIGQDADEILCLLAPPYFDAVSAFYQLFDQTDDQEVLDLLRRHATLWLSQHGENSVP